MSTVAPLKIAVVGTGISGLAAAWLLSGRHDVTVYERGDRPGGHANTVRVSMGGRRIEVDTGFIVFNRVTYPNLTALLEHLDVPTQASDMSLSVSIDAGAFEYSGSIRGLCAQPSNLINPRFWSMLSDLLRFYRQAPRDPALRQDEDVSLGEYLARNGYGEAFRDDHLLPMAGAIWSAAPADILAYPAAAFVRFHDNHGLLRLRGRPVWETVVGGSRTYVAKLARPLAGRIRLNNEIRRVFRTDAGVVVDDRTGTSERYDHVVMAGHADETLAALADADEQEKTLLGAFRYSRNVAVLHSDESLMPRRRPVWSSWNCLVGRTPAQGGACVTYWMNRLQSIDSPRPLFVTLNPSRPPRAGLILHSEVYDHPVFDAAAIRAQRSLWLLQGLRNTWFCGAYFGAGFHEDGLQAGLAVAEQLGGVRRPWKVENQSSRIVVTNASVADARAVAA